MRAFSSIVANLLIHLHCVKSNNEHPQNEDGQQQNLITHTLSNGISIPLIGMGIGNLPHENIPGVITSGLQEELDFRLIDTARASRNERKLGEIIWSFDQVAKKSDSGPGSRRAVRGAVGEDDDSDGILHVVTKVWYTHLGYERTKLSVQESLEELHSAFGPDETSKQINSSRQIYVHMLIHWPRCKDDVSWMNCEKEENDLPQFVKDLGPPPHLNKDTAWKDSWRALEDMYKDHENLRLQSREKKNGVLPNQPILASIGVSNFEMEDMKDLIDMARIRPHIYQGNSWLIFHHPYLMEFLRQHDIFFQAYGVFHGILQGKDRSPSAYGVLKHVLKELGTKAHTISEGNAQPQKSQLPPSAIGEGTVILAYFLHSNIGVIPRASSKRHQHENSPRSLSAILPHLTSSHIDRLELALPALMKGDPVHASISFENSLPGPIQIHWINSETEEEVLVHNILHSGDSTVIQSHPGHKFVTYDTEREIKREFVVGVGYGEKQSFRVEL